MKTATVTLESVSPYSQSKYHQTAEKSKEAPDDYDKRTWREHCHYDENGRIFVPPMALKFCLETAAAYLSIKIRGKGNATYSKHFKAGVLVLEGMELAITKDEVIPETFFMNADGKRGSGKRVPRCYPTIPEWTGTVEFKIMDDIITEDVFKAVLTAAGQFIGIGRFRPEKGGFYGRFDVVSVEWGEEE